MPIGATSTTYGKIRGNLSNFEIDALLKDIPGYMGTYMKDQLHKIPVADLRTTSANRSRNAPNLSAVINLDDSSRPGTHWVAIVIDYKLPFTEYFDSYGLQPPIEVIKFLRKYTAAMGLVKPERFQDTQLQEDNSDLCGYYCAYYIKERAKGVMPEPLLERFDQRPSPRNEKIVSDYFIKKQSRR